MAAPSTPHTDYHDLVRDEIALVGCSGPFRLCPGLGRRAPPAPQPAAPPECFYEQILNAEPLRIRPRRDRDSPLPMFPGSPPTTQPSPGRPASIDAVYELLSDGIFAQRTRSDPVDIIPTAAEPKREPKAVVDSSSSSRKRRVPQLRAFVGGGGSTSTHNVAIAERVRYGRQRLRRCIQRSQSALLENLRSSRRAECDDCGAHCGDRQFRSQRSESNVIWNATKYTGEKSRRSMIKSCQKNDDLDSVTPIKNRIQRLLRDCEHELQVAERTSSATGKSNGRATPSVCACLADDDTEPPTGPGSTMNEISSSNDGRHSDNGASRIPSRACVTPESPASVASRTESGQRVPASANRPRLSSRRSGNDDDANDPDGNDPSSCPASVSVSHRGPFNTIFGDIVDFALAPEPSASEPSRDPSPDLLSDSDAVARQPVLADELRREFLHRIRDALAVERRRQRLAEKRLVNTVNDLRQLIGISQTTVTRLRYEQSQTAKQRQTMQRAKAKIVTSRSEMTQAAARLFLVVLRHRALLSGQRRLLVDRFASRWPHVILRLVSRTWAAYVTQTAGPARALTRRAVPIADRVRARFRRNYLTIWSLRTRRMALYQRLDEAAASALTASPFYRWRALSLYCQRIRASIAGRPALQAPPPYATMLAAYQTRLHARLRHVLGVDGDDDSGPNITEASERIPDDDRMGELVAALHRRWIRRAAYCRWTFALYALRRQHHLDALGQWHLLRRMIQRWRDRVGQIRDFLVRSDERRSQRYLWAMFRHWFLVRDQRLRTRQIVNDVICPHRLLKRCLIRWRRIASSQRAQAESFAIVVNERRGRWFRAWKKHANARQRLRNVLGRIEALHLRLQFGRQWARWRDRVRDFRLVTRVFRDAVTRWIDRLQRNRVGPVQAFSAWIRYVDSRRRKRIRAAQSNTAALFDGIRVRVWAMRKWRQAWLLHLVMRAWRGFARRANRNRDHFLLKWRYLVPVSKAFRALRANVSVARRAQALIWKAERF